MRYSRHNKILELIKSEEIDTQERLVDRLNECGFKATQATVSRDIKELGLVKTAKKGGRSYYVQAPENSLDDKKYSSILKQTVTDIKKAENIIVIHTLSGCAGAAAEIIDRIAPESVVGTLAGDNTIFVAVNSRENVDAVVAVFRNALL